MHFNLGELFCGPGGMAYASTQVSPVESAGHEVFSLSHSWGVDLAPYAIETFKANLGEDKGIQMNAKRFMDTTETTVNLVVNHNALRNSPFAVKAFT